VAADEGSDALYRIGAVGRLAGLPASTIRTWERRYAAVIPTRSPAGGRLYSDADVVRLQLLKRLSERGAAVGELARLSTEQLQARSASREGATPEGRATTRVALLSEHISSLLEDEPTLFGGWEVAVEARGLEAFASQVAEAAPMDLVVLDLALLGEAPERGFERCAEAAEIERVVVVYHFAPRGLLERLADAGAQLLRAPFAAGALARMAPRAPRLLPEPSEGEPEPPRFDAVQLTRLRHARSPLECECPHHLAEVLERLVAFERYSAQCEARFPADAEVHAALRRGAGHARVRIDRLLAMLLAYEGIEL
jgi:DNA-binding transcriptional MerR regulator